MVPNINARGHSFKGVSAYLMHDKGAVTSERVAWTSTHNLYTDDVEKAAKVMAWTDEHREENKDGRTGRKAEAGNVYHWSLSWALDETPTRAEMEEAAHASVRRLALENHEYYFVAHNDTKHAHVHIVANLVDPETGLVANVYRDQKKLDRWAQGYEQEHGIKCENRNSKYQAWEEKKRAFSEKERRAEYTQKVTAAYHRSDSAKGFQSALDLEGLRLARGNRRGFVVVDEQGEVYALNKLVQFDGEIKGRDKTKAINERLKSVDVETLPMADTLAAQRKAEIEQKNQEREEAKATAKEAKAIEQAEYEAQQARIRVLAWGKEQRERLEKAQRIERQRLEGRLKWERQDKEASIRKRWRFHIEQNRQTETTLKAKLERGGVRGVLFRLRHGKEAREDIENARKSRLNAEKRQGEEIGLLDKRDRYHHAKMSHRHKNERQALEQGIGTALARGEIPTREKVLVSEKVAEKAQVQKAEAIGKQQSGPSAGLGKMRSQEEIQEAVKKQGWQEPPPVAEQFSENGGVGAAAKIPEKRYGSFSDYAADAKNSEQTRQSETPEQSEDQKQHPGPRQGLN